MRTLNMTTDSQESEREARRSERLLKLSLVLALGLMGILLALCMGNHMN